MSSQYVWAQGQFAPAAGKAGSTAIHGDSSCFVDWALATTLNLGMRQINVADSGLAAVGTENSAVGKSRKNGVVSLGDGGSVILYFNPPIINGPGFDFAVFENAFNDSFLELAHVEISENGIDYYRFPSVSLTQIDSQTATFGPTSPENIHNLAGKYRMPFGTPFDIDEIVDSNLPTLFYFVKITDVVGSINSLYATRDSKGNIINDPWPTNFASSGFDLDAVGVINQGVFNGLMSPEKEKMVFYHEFNNEITAIQNLKDIQIFTVNGSKVLEKNTLKKGENLSLSILSAGIYILKSESGFQRFSIQ